MLVGLSVMSSMYLDTAYQVLDAALSATSAPVVCGGAFATMFPQKLLERGASFVLRADGEENLRRLADALRDGTDFTAIPSLCWMEGRRGPLQRHRRAGTNEVDQLRPAGGGQHRAPAYIEHDTLAEGDPQLSTRSYEVIASRGCPFTCSYCCCVNLRRLLPKGVHGVRTRSVKSVIDELVEAKKKCKKLVFVHFYDEIFPNLPGWVDEFVKEYGKRIHLPFTIWSHPKMVDLETLKKLKSVGLTEVIMGIQSGSERVRRDIFHRYETQEEILNAIKAIRAAGVFWGSFDLMLQHPFETIQDLKESYYLVKQFPSPYELQLHGLNFLPGTDIVDMAIDQGLCTAEEMEGVMFAPMEEQFGAYWKQDASQESQAWYRMIYCWQFEKFRKKLLSWESDPTAHMVELDLCYAQAQKMARTRYLYKKGYVVWRRMVMGLHPTK